MQVDPHPINYRAEIVERIMQHLAAGDSCAVVGIGSVGKSNLLRFLLRDDVRQTYLGDEWESYLFVYIDINKILKRSLWGFFELMLHQLMIELTNLDMRESVLKTVDDLHQRTIEPQGQRLALRYLDRAIRLVCNQLKLRLVFLIDEFDEMSRTLPNRGFSALRALRDEYKYRLMYLVATRAELRQLREDTIMQIESFEELISPYTHWLGPYSENDARFMLQRLANRNQDSLDEALIAQILQATGGHPGLLREAYQVARRSSPSDFFEVLAGRESVRAECQRIWLSLTEEEQQALAHLVDHTTMLPHQAEIVKRLRAKGLVGGLWAEDNHIFSPLLAQYLSQEQPRVGSRIHIDHKRHSVWVNGREVRDLPPLEYKLISYLEEKHGQVCTRDELAEHLYPEDMAATGPGVTDTRLDSVVKRLRKQIESNPKNPKYILTVRGHGFRLADHPETT